MKTVKITYWVLTGIVGLLMILSGYMYFTNPMAKQGFAHLGFPDYLRVELGIAKLLGALALLLPVPRRVKEWTYAGFAINFISALIAHIASGDEASKFIMLPILLTILIGSYITYDKLQTAKQ